MVEVSIMRKEKGKGRRGCEEVTRILLDLPTDLLVRLDAYVEAARKDTREADLARGSPMPGMFAPSRAQVVARALRNYLDPIDRLTTKEKNE